MQKHVKTSRIQLLVIFALGVAALPSAAADYAEKAVQDFAAPPDFELVLRQEDYDKAFGFSSRQHFRRWNGPGMIGLTVRADSNNRLRARHFRDRFELLLAQAKEYYAGERVESARVVPVGKRDWVVIRTINEAEAEPWHRIILFGEQHRRLIQVQITGPRSSAERMTAAMEFVLQHNPVGRD